jgi:hypothetical protein
MTEMVFEMLVQYKHLTQLIAREDYIKFSCHESSKTYNMVFNPSRYSFPNVCFLPNITENESLIKAFCLVCTSWTVEFYFISHKRSAIMWSWIMLLCYYAVTDSPNVVALLRI